MKLINLFFTFHALQFCLEAMFLVLKYDITNVKYVCIYLFVSSFVFLLTSAHTHALIHEIAFSLIFFFSYIERSQKYFFGNFPFYIFSIILSFDCNINRIWPSTAIYSIFLTNTIKAD